MVAGSLLMASRSWVPSPEDKSIADAGAAIDRLFA